MSKISKFLNLKIPGPFDNFSWPNDLPSFGRFNLILGANASGKTTLSRVFRHIENGSDLPPRSQFKVITDNSQFTKSDFPNNLIQVRVFNRDFVEENVFPVKGQNIPLILVLGQESAEKKKQIGTLERELLSKRESLSRLKEETRNANKHLDDYCIHQAKEIKEQMRAGKSRIYDEYNKTHYSRDLNKLLDKENYRLSILSHDQRTSHFHQIKEEIKDTISELSFLTLNIDDLASSVSVLLSKTVTTSLIDKLKHDRELGEWVRKGLDLHQTNNYTICQFCEQEIPAERFDVLEGYFNRAFEQFISDLENQIQEYNCTIHDIKQLLSKIPIRTQFYKHIMDDYDSASNALRTTLRARP
ncbi:MAG: AAA family ATPase [Bacteroidetes bacterium]|nr:AAA family ATPase [Bacteroidota bacterium]